MKPKLLLALLLVATSMLISGCWSRKELNELAIASAIGIDKAGEEFEVSVQIVTPGEIATKMGGGGYQSPVTVYKAKAKTLMEALRKMNTLAPRKVYLSHLRVIVFGEQTAREGIGPALDYLARDREVREEDLFVLIAKGERAEDILKVLTHLDKIPAMKIFGALRTLHNYYASTSDIKLSELTYELITGTKQMIVPGIQRSSPKEGDTKQNVEKVESDTYLQIAQNAVFRKDKLIGWLSEEESKGYNYITDNVRKSVGHVPCPHGDGMLALDIIRTKTKLKGSVVREKPQIEIALRMEVNVMDVQCDVDLTDPSTIVELQREGTERLQEMMRSSIKKAQMYKSDIFGFGEVLHRSDPAGWKTIRDEWEQLFPSATVKINADVFIRNLGTITNSVLNEVRDRE